jgi:hypothetical protein
MATNCKNENQQRRNEKYEDVFCSPFAFFVPSWLIAGINYESQSISQKDLRQVQNHTPPRRRARDLCEPEA